MSSESYKMQYMDDEKPDKEFQFVVLFVRQFDESANKKYNESNDGCELRIDKGKKIFLTNFSL